jgi:hypothetical protein
VAGALIPDVSLSRLQAARRAQVVVRPQRSSWGAACEALAAHLPGRALPLAPPFGVEGSRAWLHAVAAEVGRAEALDAAWHEAWHELRAGFEATVARASAQRLGFLLQAPAARRLLTDGGLAGLPALDMALEAGFGVVVGLIGEAEVPPDVDALARPHLDAGRRLAVRPVPTEAALDALLADGTLGAVLSEFFEDDRLTSRGVGRFSLADLEAGPAGAVRTAARLLARCTVPLLCAYSRPAAGSPDHA